MKLSDLQSQDYLDRPEGNKRSIEDGVFKGEISHAELQEWGCNFSKDGTRVVVNICVEVEDTEGDLVDLYIAPNYGWSKRGHLMKVLENLELLPAPGERLNLENLVGIPVQVTVENVVKDGETYSNIIRLKRLTQNRFTSARSPEKKVIRKRPIPKSFQDEADNIFDEPEESEYEELDSIDEM